MESTLESPVPVRFVFVFVGPAQSGIDFSECGRAMGALMGDWVRELNTTSGIRRSREETLQTSSVPY